MSSLVNIVTEMQSLKPVSKIDLETVDPKVRVGMEGRKRSAQERLSQLVSEYSKTVWDKAVFVVPVNAKSTSQLNEFVQYADEFAEFMPVSYVAWDKQLGKSWWDANGKKPQNIETVHTIQLFDALRTLMVSLNMTSLNTPTVPRQIPLNSEEQCVEAVKKITTDGCGMDFRLALLQNEASSTALKMDWVSEDGQPVPFVLLDVTDADVTALEKLVPSKFYKVDLGTIKGDNMEEFTKKTLEKIARTHKKSK